MKTGSITSLTSMAAELERRQNAKKDFIAPTTALELLPDLSLNMNGAQLSPTAHFRKQVQTHFKVPADYADRIRTAHPSLYQTTINTFFRGEPARRMVRTLDGTARAFLSDRYRPLDNFDLANAVLPFLLDLPDARIESMEFTETRFYLKAVLPRIQGEVKRGDVVQAGVVISNSEVGNGALSIQPMTFRLVCLNGMIAQDYGQRRYHVGRKADDLAEAYEVYSDQTKRLEDAAFFSKVQDTMKRICTGETLAAIIAKMQAAQEQLIKPTAINAAIEEVTEKFSYSKRTGEGILAHLIAGGDLSKYGLMNAITRQSQDEEDYEMATQLEADGGRIIELAQTDWRKIAEAA